MLMRTALLPLALLGMILPGVHRQPGGFLVNGVSACGRPFTGTAQTETLSIQAMVPDGSTVTFTTTMNPNWARNSVVLELEPDESGYGQVLRAFGWTGEVVELAGRLDLTTPDRGTAPVDLAGVHHLRIEHRSRLP
jgi:hypothetical protein